MIEVRHFDDRHALQVFTPLDGNDYLEAALVRGDNVAVVSLFADWRANEVAAYFSRIVLAERPTGLTPFAVFGLYQSGVSGVANAAMVARSHLHFRRELLELAVELRRGLPTVCADLKLHRIEARCWSKHPTAARLLRALGFHHEADLPGFGPQGSDVFRQFAFLPSNEV